MQVAPVDQRKSRLVESAAMRKQAAVRLSPSHLWGGVLLKHLNIAATLKSRARKTRRRYGAFEGFRMPRGSRSGMRGAHGPTARGGMVWVWLWRVGARPAGDGAGAFRAPAVSRIRSLTHARGQSLSFGDPPPNPSFPMATWVFPPSSLRVCRTRAGPARSPAPAWRAPMSLTGAVSRQRDRLLLSHCLSARAAALVWTGCGI